MNVSLLNYTIHTYHSGTRFHCINPRSREGSDVQMLRLQFSYILISIHAPARGATAATHNHVRSSRFQSTLPRGERLRALAEYIHPCRFQSTLPRGERRYCADILFTLFLFQSTLPRGERLIRSCQLIRFTLRIAS